MNKKNHVILSLIVVIGLIFIPLGKASAQANLITVYFDPDPAYLYTTPSNTLVVDIKVTNAVDIWSYTIIVDYNAAVAVLQSYEVMDIFSGTMCQYAVNDPGHLGLGCVSWGGVPFNGDGTVVRLTFVGVSTGQTPLTFGALTNFANTTPQQVPIVRQHGVLNVVDPTNFQYLPLIMNVSVQGALNRGGVGVALARGIHNGMGPYSGTSLNQPGENLTIANVVADTYRLHTNHPRVLNVPASLNKRFTLAAGANHVPALRLASGNAVWTDNEINIQDWTAVCGALGNPSLFPDADVNFDGAVDARDLALVAGNWGLTSAVAYAAWLP